jgi:hypothetical protein
LGLGISGSDIIPVDNVPDVLDVVRSSILVLQVISVLPDIKAQQGNQASGGQQRILIRSSDELEALIQRIVSLAMTLKSM